MSDDIHTDSRSVDRDRRIVGVADYAVATAGETLVAYGIGACVGIGLSDTDNGVHALSHTMLPNELDESTAPPGKFADTTVRAVLREMVSQGATHGAMEAWLVGGADIFPLEDLGLESGVGDQTVSVAREGLSGLGIPVVAEVTGGEHGHTVEFDTATGEVLLRRADGEVLTLRDRTTN